MTYGDVRRNGLKVRWHEGIGMVVQGYDKRFYIVHDNRGWMGDDAGPIKKLLGYSYSWALGNFDDARTFDPSDHLIQEVIGVPSESVLEFKTVKRFSL